MKKSKILSVKERNILKYRSYQIMLYLFYVEDLKRFIIQSLSFSKKISGASNKNKKFDDYLEQIVSEDIITAEEKKELVQAFICIVIEDADTWNALILNKIFEHQLAYFTGTWASGKAKQRPPSA